jgi:hypothetical protein
MVLLKTTLSGIALLVVAVLLITVMGQYVTMEVQQTQRIDVEPHAEFLVGDVADRSYSIPSGVSVFGTVTVTQAPSNQTSDIHFFVLDADNYQKWASGGSATYLFSADQGHFNYTFSAENPGVYHFVFDNRASLFKKFVTLTVSYNEVLTSHVPDPRVQYMGWGLLVAGCVVLVYGLARKPPTPWS